MPPTRPTRSRTGSSRSPSPRPRSSASAPSPAPRPATSPTRSPPTPPRPGSSPTSSSPPTWRSRSCSPPASTGPTWSASTATTTTSTGSARSSPRTRPWAFVNVNLRPYYAEGSKTLAFETVEQLGWQLPDRVVSPIASGSLFTKLGRGFQEWLDIGLVEGGQPTFNGAQATGCSPVAPPSPKAGTSASRSARTRSPKASRSAIRPTGPTRSSTRARPAAAIDAVTDQEIREGDQAARRDDRDLHRDRGRRDDRRAPQAGRTGRAAERRKGRRLHHRRGTEDPRRDPRYVLRCTRSIRLSTASMPSSPRRYPSDVPSP